MTPALGWLLWAGCSATHRYPDGSDLPGQLEREVIALMQQKAALEEKLAGCPPSGPSPAYTLAVELQQVFLGSEVKIRRRGDLVGVSVQTSVLFSDPYARVFRTEGEPVLDLLATALRLHPELDVWVVGHTSDVPPRQNGRAQDIDLVDLSVRLAEAVARRFVREGIPAARLSVAGRGPNDPVGSNDLEAGRDANARIDVWLSPPGPVVP